jgi:hypothetical protein
MLTRTQPIEKRRAPLRLTNSLLSQEPRRFALLAHTRRATSCMNAIDMNVWLHGLSRRRELGNWYCPMRRSRVAAPSPPLRGRGLG